MEKRYVNVCGDLATIGCEFLRELTDGETWAPHPVNGIVICHPERAPLWCRMDAGAYRQDWLAVSPGEAVYISQRKMDALLRAIY
jgi:hypothetical protein